MRSLPPDYQERAYAAVLGKLIGVYLGRPFENWTYQRIVRDLGPIEYYVHDRLDCPLVVTDDDVAGTFTFIRALEEHGAKPDISSREIGQTWLNAIVENRSILWWGGAGNSTEHTAWLNLKRGVEAPASGSIEVNGRTIAEQIGAQIFIDGWAIVAAGDPALAARLAEQAARVSHDGAAVEAAKLWAAMEAEAFVSRDMEHVIDVGLSQIAPSSPIARLAEDIREWRTRYTDWRDAREEIERRYGYDKYPGNCHVVPNHALMIMAALYAPNDFSLAQTIVCTSGWDTDCNAGNVGCLLGAMLGLEGLEAGKDWRGPLADRMLISSADGGFAINDAVRVSGRLVNLGRRLAGLPRLEPPKDGAQFHFSERGSAQGFMPSAEAPAALRLANAALAGGRALNLRYDGLTADPVAALTPTFAPPDVTRMRTYELMATPLVCPGQWVSARVIAARSNLDEVHASLRILVYGREDRLGPVDGGWVDLRPGAETVLRWRLPDTGGQPVQSVGLALRSAAGGASGAVVLDYLRWDGAPDVRLRRPDEPGDFWRRAWVNAVSVFSTNFPQAFRISQDRGEGMIIQGGSQWTDYRVQTALTVHLGRYAGVGVRVQGLRRHYAALLVRPGLLRLIRVRDGKVAVLAEAPFDWAYDEPYAFDIQVVGCVIAVAVGAARLEVRDESAEALADGGVSLIVNEGACSTDEVRVSASQLAPSIAAVVSNAATA
jgi:ADP-ribosylglycohydrolase